MLRLPPPRPRVRREAFAALAAVAIVWTAAGQQAETVSSIGLRAGVATYYGELNDALFPARPELRDLGANLGYLSWGVDVERYFGNGWGVGLLYTNAEFSASDRAIDWDGDLDLDADDFGRALNVSTSVNDLAVYGLWSANDGRVLSETATLAPYVKFGLGVTRFEPRGDLFVADGRRYRYETDGTVSALDPADGVAVPLPAGVDGVYETDLRPLRTNGGSEYSRYAYHLLGGLGINLRLGERFALQLETIARLTTTDNLDDVSGAVQVNGPDLTRYASNPSGRDGLTRGESGNDAYALTTLTARFYLGDRSETFRTPLVLVGDLPLGVEDTTTATSRLFRFEPLEPLATDSLTVEPVVLRPQRALAVPRPVDRVAAPTLAHGEDVPAIEDFADPAYTPPVFDEAVFGVDTSARAVAVSDTVARPVTVVREYPAAVADDSLAVDDAVVSAIDSLGVRVATFGPAPLDSLAADEIDSLEALTEPVDFAIDTLAVARIDSLREVDAARNRELDSLTARMSTLRAADSVSRAQVDSAALVVDAPPFDSLAVDGLAVGQLAVDSTGRDGVAADGSAVSTVQTDEEGGAAVATDAPTRARSGALDSLRRAIDSLRYARERDARLREGLDRQLRAARADRERAAQSESVAASRARSEPVGQRSSRENDRPAEARYREQLARMSDEQAELRRQLAALTAEVAALRAAPAVAGPVAPAVAPTPRGSAGAPAPVDPEQAALLAELRALRREVSTLRAPVSPVPVAQIAAPGDATLPTNPSGAGTGTDERVAVFEALRLQDVRRVFFETGRAEVSTSDLGKLEEVAIVARRYPGYVEIGLEGFTDRTGSQAANQRLSERRVRAVRAALERLGVAPAQIRVQPMGEDFDADDLAFARRVEVRLRLR